MVIRLQQRGGEQDAGDELLSCLGARKHEGSPVVKGTTDAMALLRLKHVIPAAFLRVGEDEEGGVFVSENFYYDSEIYEHKLYALPTGAVVTGPARLGIVKGRSGGVQECPGTRCKPIACARCQCARCSGTLLQTHGAEPGCQGGGPRPLPTAAENAVAVGYETALGL
ncbi:hypothetical protein FQR65_LT20936 [Abscondita terminalis]|nr:hypothetical protein FQR65_LT20936 [Abscondita terminalis]